MSIMTREIEMDSYLGGTNAAFIADLYGKFCQDPNSVDPSWHSFFTNLSDDDIKSLQELSANDDVQGMSPVASSIQEGNQSLVNVIESDNSASSAARDMGMTNSTVAQSTAQMQNAIKDSLQAITLIRLYRVRGHLNADLDPLGLQKRAKHPELDPAFYGFSEGDMDRQIYISGYLSGMEYATMREIMQKLKEIYCSHIGVEFMHIQDPEQKIWIQQRVESIPHSRYFSDEQKREIARNLNKADAFERFLNIKFPGAKRFGLEGAESTIVAIESMIARGAQGKLEEVVIGMAHRGRLNVLHNVLHKSSSKIMAEFQGESLFDKSVQGSGDVKYHLGASANRKYGDKELHLSLCPNPSHLEAVNPVALGRVRAKQEQRNDDKREKVVGLLIHGDASFIGQGLVAETLLLSQLNGYKTGGTIHLIINNQIGFTTSPTFARSSPYCSDIAKGIQAPIFHVNGDDPEAVAYVAELAMDFKQTFKVDPVIDLYCYRRQGHNEMDEPSFTQPLMYKQIKQMPTTSAVYSQKLVAESVISSSELEAYNNSVMANLGTAFDKSKERDLHKSGADWLQGVWKDFEPDNEMNVNAIEGNVTGQILMNVGAKMSNVPDSFNINKKVQRVYENRAKAITQGQGIDWSTAESLAFGTLLLEGYGVRLSGQDCGRGTFSQRHAVVTDQETGEMYTPLNHMEPGQKQAEIINSPLSEAAVLGFEYGYSITEPRDLVIWEAQFGDFANGAQVIIDNFIAAAEKKWYRMSGLVMMLPHGYEGQGPEHSSAKLERYLQLCAEDNLQVVNCTTPANFFHVLRRQMHRKIRKPLIAMTPKSLLRHKLCVSNISEFENNSHFQKVLQDPSVASSVGSAPIDPSQVRRVIICSGKIFYDLYQEREARGMKDTVIIRMEQLYPLPKKSLERVLSAYNKNASVIWCQEEPENMGAWTYIDRKLETELSLMGFAQPRPIYIGREAAASPATGFHKEHEAEQKAIVEKALSI